MDPVVGAAFFDAQPATAMAAAMTKLAIRVLTGPSLWNIIDRRDESLGRLAAGEGLPAIRDAGIGLVRRGGGTHLMRRSTIAVARSHGSTAMACPVTGSGSEATLIEELDAFDSWERHSWQTGAPPPTLEGTTQLTPGGASTPSSPAS